jgi:hypothetical protein
MTFTPLTIEQMNELLEKLKNTQDNSEKISIMEAEQYSFLPSCRTNNNHHLIDELYNACQVLHLKQSSSSNEEMIVMKNTFIKMLEKRNTNFDFSTIREIINDF